MHTIKDRKGTPWKMTEKSHLENDSMENAHLENYRNMATGKWQKKYNWKMESAPRKWQKKHTQKMKKNAK